MSDGSRLTASYLVDAPAERIEERARAIASEQSVECPLEAVHDVRVREEIVGRVASIAPATGGRFRVDVQLAVASTGGEPTQLLNVLCGNCSLWDDVQFVDVELPDALLGHFRGPRHGIAGIRELTGASRRPLTAAAVKPQGLHVPDLVGIVRTLALAGVDVIKDDHGIADQEYAPFAKRVPACQAAVAEAVRATGRPSLYAPNVSGSPRAMRERARLARELGIRVVLVAPMLVGLPAFADLVDEFPDLVYLAHPSFAGARRIAPSLLFGKLYRLFGADAPIFVNYGGRFGYAQDECGALASAARAPWGGLRPSLPVPAGGMRLERIDELLAFYGSDTMLLIGGDLLIAEGDALLTRAKAFVDAVARSLVTARSL
jgi:ribulose-bisphosphate carboxylase large chain